MHKVQTLAQRYSLCLSSTISAIGQVHSCCIHRNRVIISIVDSNAAPCAVGGVNGANGVFRASVCSGLRIYINVISCFDLDDIIRNSRI